MAQTDWQDALGALIDPSQPLEPEPETQSTPLKPQKGKLSISFEKKGRGGKQVTIISGFTLDTDSLNDVAATLKRTLGTGGSARGGEILIQGDRRADVKRLLLSLGFKL